MRIHPYHQQCPPARFANGTQDHYDLVFYYKRLYPIIADRPNWGQWIEAGTETKRRPMWTGSNSHYILLNEGVY